MVFFSIKQIFKENKPCKKNYCADDKCSIGAFKNIGGARRGSKNEAFLKFLQSVEKLVEIMAILVFKKLVI